MKKVILSLLLVSAIGISSYAQCNQRVTFNASKTDYLDGSGSVKESKNEMTSVNFDNQDISILCNGQQLTGTVTSSSCDWKKSFSEGRTVLKGNLSSSNGDNKNTTLTMEGKDGNVSLLIEMENMPARKLAITSDAFRGQQ